MRESLSNIIKEMIAPYHDGDIEDVDLLVSVAQCAWNMNLLPEDLSKEILKDFLALFEDEKEIKQLIDTFYLYKKMNYSDDDRLFIDYDFIRVDDEGLYKFEVQSTPYDEENYHNNFKALMDEELKDRYEIDEENKKGSFIFTAKLRPGLWRKIQINKTATLDDLHYAILDAFEFNYEHLYSFFMDNKAWSEYCYSSPYDDYGEDASKVYLYELGLEPKFKFLYLYDYGDEWRFSISVFKELDTTVEKPEVIKVKGEAPTQYDYYDDEEYE